MKKLLAASVLALALVAGSQQPASAWCNFKFGVGLNMEFSSGNNNCFWGMFKSGQVPDGSGYSPFVGGSPFGYAGGPFGGYNSPSPYYASPDPGFTAPAPTPLPAHPGPASQTGAYASYYYPQTAPANYNQPANYYQYANYSYPANYYPMSYAYPYYGYNYGFNFYGN
jgi:hypothetical protein